MKFLFLLLIFSINIFAKNIDLSKLERISPEQSFQLIEVIDCLTGNSLNNCPENTQCWNIFFQLTSISNEIINGLAAREAQETLLEIRDHTLKLLSQQTIDNIGVNSISTTWFSKFVGLMTFSNILGFIGVFIAIAFLFSLTNSLLLIISLKLAELLLNKKALYFYGFSLSFLTTFYQYDQIQDSTLGYFFFLQDFSPLFGCLLFAIVFLFFYEDYVTYKGMNQKIKESKEFLQLPYYIIVGLFYGYHTLYHHDYLIGILTVLVFYSMVGYGMRSIQGGYQFGFRSDQALYNCFLFSAASVPIFTILKIKAESGNLDSQVFNLWDQLQYFETGVLFWGTFIGCLSALILSDYDFNLFYQKSSLDKFLFYQMIFVVWTLGLLFIGSIYSIPYFTNIAGTFGILWILSLEKSFISKFSDLGVTLFLGIILVNIYGLRYYIQNYPDFFIIY